jgi:hypothetical protein
VVRFLLRALLAPFRSRLASQADNLALRHQLAVYQRTCARPRLLGGNSELCRRRGDRRWSGGDLLVFDRHQCGPRAHWYCRNIANLDDRGDAADLMGGTTPRWRPPAGPLFRRSGRGAAGATAGLCDRLAAGHRRPARARTLDYFHHLLVLVRNHRRLDGPGDHSGNTAFQ